MYIFMCGNHSITLSKKIDLFLSWAGWLDVKCQQQSSHAITHCYWYASTFAESIIKRRHSELQFEVAPASWRGFCPLLKISDGRLPSEQIDACSDSCVTSIK